VTSCSAHPADEAGDVVELDQTGTPSAALERGDDIVQQLSIAKYALAVGDTEQAMEAIDAALTTSRGSLSDLAGANASADNPTYAGALVRATAAGSAAPEPTPVVRPHEHGPSDLG
jgi:hypothetical protein